MTSNGYDAARFLLGADDDIEIRADKPLRMSANALRALRKGAGRPMSELMEDDSDDGNRPQVMAFLELYSRAQRAGHPVEAGELWQLAGDIEVIYTQPPAPDPLAAESSPISPRSVTTGE
jgi:hypothetical protein